MENKKVYRVKGTGKAFKINGLRTVYVDEKFVKMYQKSRSEFGEYFKKGSRCRPTVAPAPRVHRVDCKSFCIRSTAHHCFPVPKQNVQVF